MAGVRDQTKAIEASSLPRAGARSSATHPRQQVRLSRTHGQPSGPGPCSRSACSFRSSARRTRWTTSRSCCRRSTSCTIRCIPRHSDMVADGQRIRVSGSLVSGPVAAYLLGCPSVLLGGAERAAHLAPLLLMLLSVLATVMIGLRLGLERSEARLAGLLLASTPAAVGMATTSMADVPAMAFAVIGMERMLAWRDDGRWHQGIAAALAFGLAALARPQLVLIVAIGAASPSGQAHAPLGWATPGGGPGAAVVRDDDDPRGERTHRGSGACERRPVQHDARQVPARQAPKEVRGVRSSLGARTAPSPCRGCSRAGGRCCEIRSCGRSCCWPPWSCSRVPGPR